MEGVRERMIGVWLGTCRDLEAEKSHGDIQHVQSVSERFTNLTSLAKTQDSQEPGSGLKQRLLRHPCTS
jgi:hypothetical protein